MEESVMKKSLLLILTIAYCMVGNAIMPAVSWVVSKDGLMNCKQVSVKNSKAKILLHDGKNITIPLAQINSYSQDGKMFKKLNLYRDGKPTNRMEFMQLLKIRDGYCLYKYNRYDAESPYDCYYIYKGDQLCYALDKSMKPKRIINLFQYFGFRAVVSSQPVQAS